MNFKRIKPKNLKIGEVIVVKSPFFHYTVTSITKVTNIEEICISKEWAVPVKSSNPFISNGRPQ